MNGVSFAWVLALALAGLALLGAGVWLWARRRRAIAEALGDRPLVLRLVGEDLHRLPRLRIAAVLLAGLTLSVALLEGSTRIDRPPFHAARDVVLVLDVSNSMLVEDAQPNRLEWMRGFARQTAGSLAEDRVGLIAFAGEAVVLSPPTRDVSSIAMYLDALDPGIATQTGSALGAGVRQAAALLAAGPGHPGGRVVIMVTDGEPVGTEDRDDVVDAVRRAAALGVVVHTVGVGTASGGPVPDIDPDRGVQVGYKRDPETGEIAISRMHPDLLRSLARSAGGAYVEAADPRAVQRFLAAVQPDDELGDRPREGFAHWIWLAGLAAVILGLDAARELRVGTGRRVR